jgi:hypothetical protein
MPHYKLAYFIYGTVHCWSGLAAQETLSNPISTLFWDITQPIVVIIYESFGKTYRYFVKSTIINLSHLTITDGELNFFFCRL